MWRFWLIMKMNRINKRGGVGDFITMVFSIIAILFILAGFVLMAGTFIRFVESPAGVASHSESGLEKDLFEYMEKEYNPFLESRFEFRKEVGIR